MKLISIKLFFSIVFLFVLTYIVANSIKMKDLQQAIVQFNSFNLLFIILISTVLTLIKVMRFFILLKHSEIDISFWDTLKTFVASQTTTPFPGGETLRGILVHKESGVNVIKTAGPVITQAYLEVFTAAVLALIGGLFFEELRGIIFLLFGLIISISFVIFNRGIARKVYKLLRFIFTKKWVFVTYFFNKLLAKINPQYSLSRFGATLKETIIFMQDQLEDFLFDSRKILLQTLALSFSINLIGGFLIFYIANIYKTSLNIFSSVFIYSSSIFIQGMSIFSPGGIGFTEGGMMGILLLHKISFGDAIGIVLIFRLFTLLYGIILGLIFLLVFYGRRIVISK